MKIKSWIAWPVIIGIIALSVMNASWIAPPPAGRMTLIAAGSGRPPVAGAKCEGGEVIRTLARDFDDRADYSRVVVVPSRDGTLRVTTSNLAACATDAKMAPTLAELITRLPTRKFVLELGDDGKMVEAVMNSFAAAGKPLDAEYAITGGPVTVARAKRDLPDIWAWNDGEARGCLSDYIATGWTSIVPSACRNATVIVPLDKQWIVWGWPKRFQARMAAAGTRVILTGPEGSEGIATLDQAQQIPRDFTGALWMVDSYTIGPALRQ